MRRLVLVLVLLLAAACSQPAGLPQPAAFSLPDLELAGLLLQDGDLPVDFQGGAVQEHVDEAPFDQLPAPALAFSQKIKGLNQDTSNAVFVLLYDDPAQVRAAFEALVNNSFKFDHSATLLEDIGEAAAFQREELAFHYVPFEKIAFTRCHALVYIETSADTQGYARRLDGRLQDALCQ